MPRFSKEDLRALYDEIMVWADKVEEMEKMSSDTTGETKLAIAVVQKDYLWKLQRKIGQLWFYVCGVDDICSFDETIPPTSE